MAKNEIDRDHFVGAAAARLYVPGRSTMWSVSRRRLPFPFFNSTVTPG
jgi:hypothetical protein